MSNDEAQIILKYFSISRRVKETVSSSHNPTVTDQCSSTTSLVVSCLVGKHHHPRILIHLSFGASYDPPALFHPTLARTNSISGDSTVVVTTIGTISDTIFATIGTTSDTTIGTFFTFTLCWTGAACRCELHVVFAFNLHVSCSKAILAPGLVLLFEDAGRQAVQVHGHTVVVVTDVKVPVVANHLLVATLVLRLPGHVITISLPLVWLAMDAGKQDEGAEVEENHPAGGLQE